LKTVELRIGKELQNIAEKILKKLKKSKSDLRIA
tara:strand:+ start:677 stop:778 length:102 start_codon:yes stop_codon:yes gene_type:complete